MSGLASAIFEGRVRHRRMTPVEHEFDMPLCMLYLDLAELPRVFEGAGLWTVDEPAPAAWRREDYLGDPELPLDEAVRALVERDLGERPRGPVRMLTNVRYFGYCFNPVTFYYCFDPSGSAVQAIVAQITNTPWKERHAYVLEAGGLRPDDPAARFRFGKRFHVSPFMPMELEYDWAFSAPGENLFAHMNLREPCGARTKVFDATLTMRRQSITPASLRRLLVRYPLMTAQVIARIHWEALRLWLKKVPVLPHPRAHPVESTGVRLQPGETTAR